MVYNHHVVTERVPTDIVLIVLIRTLYIIVLLHIETCFNVTLL